MSDDAGDDDGSVGYGRPPRSGQFKKGKSGCPNGGHEQRRAKRMAAERKAARKERHKLSKVRNIIKEVALEQRVVQTANGRMKLATAEILVRKIVERAMSKDASDKDIRRAFTLFKDQGLFERERDKGQTGVLVVYPIMKEDEWARATEGELLPKDPLHGIPGAEGLLLENGQAPRRGPPDDLE